MNELNELKNELKGYIDRLHTDLNRAKDTPVEDRLAPLSREILSSIGSIESFLDKLEAKETLVRKGEVEVVGERERNLASEIREKDNRIKTLENRIASARRALDA